MSESCVSLDSISPERGDSIIELDAFWKRLLKVVIYLLNKRYFLEVLGGVRVQRASEFVAR